MRKIFWSVIFAFLGLLTFASYAHASEGISELRSTNGASYRCFAASLLMTNARYEVIVSCRDLIYPPQPELSSYILWANPVEQTNPVRLGDLGVGKARFEARTAFNSLFVTLEKNKDARSPSGTTVMRGQLRKIDFLESLGEVTISPEEEAEEMPETKSLSTRERLFLALRRAGIAALLALVTLIGLIFVITRSRG